VETNQYNIQNRAMNQVPPTYIYCSQYQNEALGVGAKYTLREQTGCTAETPVNTQNRTLTAGTKHGLQSRNKAPTADTKHRLTSQSRTLTVGTKRT
jgi:hypothetical protein